MWLLSAFSPKMLGELTGAPGGVTVNFSEISEEKVREAIAPLPPADPEVEDCMLPGVWEVKSAVGHPATAEVLSARLGVKVEANRVNVTLKPGEAALLAQVQLPRLAEGQVLTAEEVAQAPISFMLVEVEGEPEAESEYDFDLGLGSGCFV